MLEQDYLMRLILQLVEGMRRSLFKEQTNPKEAAGDLEDTLSDALDLDMHSMLTLSPDSFAAVMEVSGVDPNVVEFVVRSLVLEASMLEEAGKSSLAQIRLNQADSLADRYGMESFRLDEAPTLEELEELAAKVNSED